MPVRSFRSVRRGREYRIWADSFQMHFWFVWFPGRYIENENITTVYPLTLLRKKRNFFSLLRKGTVISLYHARSPLCLICIHIYIHMHTFIYINYCLLLIAFDLKSVWLPAPYVLLYLDAGCVTKAVFWWIVHCRQPFIEWAAYYFLISP